MPPTSASVYKPGDKCESCGLTRCQCIRCGICNERVPRKTTCDKCHSCASHHDGYYPKDFPHRRCDYTTRPSLAPTTFAINPLHRTIGVEMELGGFGAIASRGANKWINWEILSCPNSKNSKCFPTNNNEIL